MKIQDKIIILFILINFIAIGLYFSDVIAFPDGNNNQTSLNKSLNDSNSTLNYGNETNATEKLSSNATSQYSQDQTYRSSNQYSQRDSTRYNSGNYRSNSGGTSQDSNDRNSQDDAGTDDSGEILQ
ncbi:hypothetical protein [Methanobacterium sp.]|uniref:hypothetical protein n=1 Tax=Methanobacterium sp. TaxID=2164 RepID=UPI0031585359